MVLRSLSLRSSGTGNPNIEAVLAKISTCLTVSMPRSASRSKSGSSMSVVYPVCSAIICFTFSMESEAAAFDGAGSGTGADNTGVGTDVTGVDVDGTGVDDDDMLAAP